MAGSDDEDGGVNRRLLGSFLTWLQEHDDGVFVVATVNDLSRLPPELLRKGLFDESFFVDLPDAAERRAIFHIYLELRKQRPDALIWINWLSPAMASAGQRLNGRSFRDCTGRSTVKSRWRRCSCSRSLAIPCHCRLHAERTAS